MSYFLLIIILGNSVLIESYPTNAECEMRREAVKIDHPGVNTKCLQMETKNYV